MVKGTTIWHIIASLSLVCCVVSPMPVPPNIETDGIDPTVCVHCGKPQMIKLDGAPGTIVPSEALLWVVNFDETYPPQTFEVASDGSFDVSVYGYYSHELRFQARQGNLRSEPVDLVFRDEGSLIPPDRPYESCLFLDPDSEVDFGSVRSRASRSVEIRNQCGQDLTFSPVRLRIASENFEHDEGPTQLGSGESVSITLSYTPTAGETAEEILFIEVTSPERDRRPLLLMGEGLPE